MKKKLVISLLIIFSVVVFVLSACEKDSRRERYEIEELEINKHEDVLAVGEATPLILTIRPVASENRKVLWSSSNSEIASVSENGVVEAKKSGSVEIIAKVEDGNIKKRCRIHVFDAIVAKDFNEEVDGFGEHRFAKVQDAIDAVEPGAKIGIMKGDYHEDLTLDKDISLKGFNHPIVKSLFCTDKKLKVELEDIDFYTNEFPEEENATLFIDEESEVHLTKCTFTVDIKNQPPDSQEGGYAIYIGQKSEQIIIKDCIVSNYNYAVFLDKTGASILFEDNIIKQSKKGIGLDIRDPESAVPKNMEASGYLGNNVYLEVELKTEFYYNGEHYSRNLDFEDYSQSEQNMQKDQQEDADE